MRPNSQAFLAAGALSVGSVLAWGSAPATAQGVAAGAAASTPGYPSYTAYPNAGAGAVSQPYGNFPPTGMTNPAAASGVAGYPAAPATSLPYTGNGAGSAPSMPRVAYGPIDNNVGAATAVSPSTTMPNGSTPALPFNAAGTSPAYAANPNGNMPGSVPLPNPSMLPSGVNPSAPEAAGGNHNSYWGPPGPPEKLSVWKRTVRWLDRRDEPSEPNPYRFRDPSTGSTFLPKGYKPWLKSSE